MSQKNFRFVFSIYFILFGIFIICFGSLVRYKINNIYINEDIRKSAYEIGALKKTDSLKPDIEKFDQMVIALTQIIIQDNYFKDTNKEPRTHLEHIFYALTFSNNLIMQMRYLDEKGFEKIRIDRNSCHDTPFVVSEKQLQDKSQRDYFQIVSHLPQGTVWHSKIDLNIEHGQIEVPLKPTLRIAQPVFDKDTFRGIVIINVMAQELLDGLTSSTGFDHYIIDKDGYFIAHPNQQYAWSRYTDSKRTIADEFPLDAKKILANQIDSETFYAFPLDDILKNEDKAILLLKANNNYKNSLLQANIQTSFLIILMSILISIPLAYFASRGPAKLQMSLLSANQELKRYAKIIDTYVITVVTKIDGIITSVSKAFEVQSQYKKEELIGQSINIVRHPDSSKELFTDLWQTISSGKEWRGEIKNRKKDGGTYYLDQTIFPTKNENNEIISYMSIGVDITAKKEIEHLAETDKLTDVYNRRKIDDFLDQEIVRANRYHTSFSFIILDIDHFKHINDTYGHAVGDLTLQTIAFLLKNFIRSSDILGRFGGEEFIVITPESDSNSAYLFAEKIRLAIEAYHFPEIDHLTVSIGIAQYYEGNTKNELFIKADDALYRAKNSGRNCVMTALNIRENEEEQNKITFII